MFAVFFKADVGRGFTHKLRLHKRVGGLHPYASFDANKSTICMARIFEPALCKPPAMFMRQPGSHITTVSAPQVIMSLTLFCIIARLTSGKVTVNEPPKPQQVSSSLSGTNSRPFTEL